MKRTALGIRMHSGWGVLVAVSGDANSVQVTDRRRIVTTDPNFPGANQPYHHAATLQLPESEIYLANSAAIAERLASEAISELVQELDARHYQIVGAAVLLASGRPLPSLSKLVASHPLIHTAEGEFFRNAVRKACERLKIPVTAIKERELDEQAGVAFGAAACRVQGKISNLAVGPPWTKDHKLATLAASLVLDSLQRL